jgi:hypothetical protein
LDLTFYFALVVAFETGQMVFAGWVVGVDQIDALVSGLGNVLADYLVEIVVLIGDAEVVGVKQLS